MEAPAALPDFGRPSAAAGGEPALRPAGDARVAHWRAEAASTAWCALRAASVAGVRHRLAGQGSDDCFAWAHDDDRLAAAVADGLGSVPGSADAAGRACRAAVEAALRAGGRVESAALAGLASANRAADGGGATTVVVAVVDRAGEAVVARVGDSSAFAVKDGGSWVELFPTADPDEVATATAALPADQPAIEVAATGVWAGTTVVLATDGIADPWRDGPTTVGPSVAAGILARPSAVDLLRLADFSRQGCHDDRTILCVWTRAADDRPAGDDG